MKSIKFAYIQSGYCVFGTGYTREQAIRDARNWLESPDGVQGGMTFEDVVALLRTGRVDGGFRLISSDDPEFDGYMKSQGGYVKRGRGWYHI